MIRRHRALAVLALMASALVVGMTPGTLALLTASATAGNNTLSTGTWTTTTIYYLHNLPTPPTGNTISEVNLPMTASSPTATHLYDYSTDMPGPIQGRGLDSSPLGLSETDVTKYVYWRTVPLTGGLTGTAVTVSGWMAVHGFGNGKQYTVTGYLRDYNPATNSYIELGSSTLSGANWGSGSKTWNPATFTFGAFSIPAGDELEFRLGNNSPATGAFWLAYDTATYGWTVKIS